MFKNRMVFVRFGALLLLTGVSACGASASFTPTGTPPHPVSPRAPEAIVLLAAPPGNEAVEIGRIEASSGVHAPTGDGNFEVLEQLRKIAGENGCDSILLGKPEESLSATSGGTPLYRTEQNAICFANR